MCNIYLIIICVRNRRGSRKRLAELIALSSFIVSFSECGLSADLDSSAFMLGGPFSFTGELRTLLSGTN